MKIRSVFIIPAESNAASKLRFWESVSTVEPDFEETTTTVLVKSPSSACRICDGSVESRTSNSTPTVLVITSGASDEPPIPHSTTRVSPFALNSADKAVSSGISAKLFCAASTQPNLIEDSASASLPQSV